MDPHQHPYLRIQQDIGVRNLWPNYIVLKLFCSYLAHLDLVILSDFFLTKYSQNS
jgi:hypothetical protein